MCFNQICETPASVPLTCFVEGDDITGEFCSKECLLQMVFQTLFQIGKDRPIVVATQCYCGCEYSHNECFQSRGCVQQYKDEFANDLRKHHESFDGFKLNESRSRPDCPCGTRYCHEENVQRVSIEGHGLVLASPYCLQKWVIKSIFDDLKKLLDAQGIEFDSLWLFADEDTIKVYENADAFIESEGFDGDDEDEEDEDCPAASSVRRRLTFELDNTYSNPTFDSETDSDLSDDGLF